MPSHIPAQVRNAVSHAASAAPAAKTAAGQAGGKIQLHLKSIKQCYRSCHYYPLQYDIGTKY
ncbi:MAG: hypothetical protein DLM72_03800 [Candidatus Nitrosopolaris wilkensis]|nr:MAG: hypothetical protein DLM72_03800 [Candidatus Nitrosopolaris wilkensis]